MHVMEATGFSHLETRPEQLIHVTSGKSRTAHKCIGKSQKHTQICVYIHIDVHLCVAPSGSSEGKGVRRGQTETDTDT